MTQAIEDRLLELQVVDKLRSAYYHIAATSKPNGRVNHRKTNIAQGLRFLADRIERKRHGINFGQLYTFDKRLYHQAIESLEEAERYGYCP